MNTRAFKKVLSVICVLAMLMSVCIVGLAGIVGAASSYTLSVNGVATSYTYEASSTLPTNVDSGVPGVEFEGWFDATLENQKTAIVAGETYYAKFSSYIYTFDGGNGYYDPANNMGKTDWGRWSVAADPTNANNKVMKVTGTQNSNFAFESVAGSGKELKLEGGKKYEISYKYYTDTTVRPQFNLNLAQATSNISNMGGKKEAGLSQRYIEISNGVWTSVSYTFTLNAENYATNPYLLFCIQPNAGAGPIYVDNIVITEIAEGKKEYSFNVKGEVTKGEYAVGESLPAVRDNTFIGWYDKTLTQRYTSIPATAKTLYAKFSTMTYDFDTEGQLYLPTGNQNNAKWNRVEYPAGSGNYVMTSETRDSRNNFAPIGAIGADAGLRLTKGQVYTISFKYQIVGAKNDVGISIDLDTAKSSGVGSTNDYRVNPPIVNKQSSISGNSTMHVTTFKGDTDGWATFTGEFVMAHNATEFPHLIITVYSNGNTGNIYVDDLSVALKTPATITEDTVMDFEDDFEWSVEDANNYTESTGNGYVNRGEIVEESGNSYFLMKHFSNRNGYFYFTINNGERQFQLANGGIYTIEFDYKVVHSETDSKIGMLYAKPSTSTTTNTFNTNSIVVFDSFETRDDAEWTHLSYTFTADLGANSDAHSLALFINNTTNVPNVNQDTGKMTATAVAFDNIVVKVHSVTGSETLVTFDSKGGDECVPIVTDGGKAVGTLPEPTRYGFDFLGWKYDVTTGTGDDIVTTTYDLTADTVIPYGIVNAYADWKVKDGYIKIEFKSNVEAWDANATTVIAAPGKEVIGMPVNPTATSQKFVGWYLDTAFTKRFDASKAPATDCVLYAKWETEGVLIDFENYPENWFNTKGQGNGSQVQKYYTLVELEDGNTVLYYDGTDTTDVNMHWPVMLYDGNTTFTAAHGMEYTIKFKYMIKEYAGAGQVNSSLSSASSGMSNRQPQTGYHVFENKPGEWKEGEFKFVADCKDGLAANGIIAIGARGRSKVYIDDVTLVTPINEMNVYGTAIILETNGGSDIPVVSGEAGSAIKLPTPKKSGYVFKGWYSDAALTTPFTETVYGTERVTIYAKWQLGKFTEGFEDFPATAFATGVAGAYKLYSSEKVATGFDASNVHSGKTSLYRNGSSAGIKNFTCMRENDLALTIGETYTLTFYVKPTSVGDATGTISILNMTGAMGITTGTIGEVLATVGELKEGEWNKVTYTFTATTQYIGMSTTAGNDLYFDDITVSLKGYTGATTGDSSVSPIVVIALALLSAVAVAFTSKKIFAK